MSDAPTTPTPASPAPPPPAARTLAAIPTGPAGWDRSGCPCLWTTPCDPRCSCAHPNHSRPCTRCCYAGNDEHRRKKAERLAAIIDAGNAAHPALRGEPAGGAAARGEQRHTENWWARLDSDGNFAAIKQSPKFLVVGDDYANQPPIIPVRVTVLGEGADGTSKLARDLFAVTVSQRDLAIRRADEAESRLAAAESAAAEARRELAAARGERDKLREAIKRGGFAVMQTSGAWDIYDVSEKGKAADAKSLEVATENVELDIELKRLRTPRPLNDWHDDDGPALWWKFPVEEPPYVGSPNDCDWPGYHTHWTPLPLADAALAGGDGAGRAEDGGPKA